MYVEGERGTPLPLASSPTNTGMEGEGAWAWRGFFGALNGELCFPCCFVSFSLIFPAGAAARGPERVV